MRRRLVLAISGVAAASVLLFALPLAIAIHRTHRDEELLRLQRDTVAAARQIDVGAGRGDPVEIPHTGDRVAVYDRRGRRLAGEGPVRADSPVSETLRDGRPADQTSNGQLRSAVALLDGERVTGAVRAERHQGVIDADVHAAWLALLAGAVVVIALAVAAALLLGRRLAAPLERIAAAARRLGEGDFAATAPRAGVAELDEVASALEVTGERLGELVSRERSFSADASHQLRTPLAALRLELESLELRGDPPAEVTAALTQVDRLEATIDTLLAVARDNQRGERSVDLTAVADQLERRWRGPLAGDGRALRVSLENPRLTAAASPPVVDQILEVLLDNAHRHGRGSVTLAVRETSGWIAVDVADEGPGLGAQPDEVFIRRSAGSNGHGIGLSLARSLATAEGGVLTAGTGPAGSVFTLRLARAPGG
jgi:signal transduction histidine kinase